MTVTLHAPTAHQFAAGHRASAEHTAASLVSLRADFAGLLPAFGLIGAEFLAALAQVLDGSVRHLDDLSAHHGSIASATQVGSQAYQHTDAAGAAHTEAVRR